MKRSSIVFLLILLASLVGCGGGNSAPATTLLRFSIGWEGRSRAISARPSALSASLTLRGAAQNGGDYSVLVNRDANPAATTQNVVTATQAVVGTWDLTVRFYAQADGAGDVVGIGNASVVIAPDGTGIDTVAIEWQIASVEILSNQSVKAGETKDLNFTARNAQNATIAVTPGSARWQVVNGDNRIRFVEGRAEGLAPGLADVSVTVDGVTASRSVRVTSDTVVDITPSNPTLSIGASQSFTANVTGTANTNVVWTIEEGAPGGTISAAGQYVAPNQPGVFHIRATSVYDTEKFDRVTVTVVAGSASGVIQ